MNGSTIFFLKTLYPNLDTEDDLGLFLYAHQQRAPGVEYRALQQLVLNLKASGLRGNRLREAFIQACNEIAEDEAISSVTPEEAGLLIKLVPEEKE
jgi:hypothetical protein